MRIAWVEPRPGADHEWIWPPVLLAGLALARFEPLLPAPFRMLCPLKHLTGLPCPSCGTTRALRALAELDLAAAWRWNPLATAGAVAALLFVLYAVVVLARGSRRLRIVELSLAERVGLVVLVALNWVWLIADGR